MAVSNIHATSIAGNLVVACSLAILCLHPPPLHLATRAKPGQCHTKTPIHQSLHLSPSLNYCLPYFHLQAVLQLTHVLIHPMHHRCLLYSLSSMHKSKNLLNSTDSLMLSDWWTHNMHATMSLLIAGPRSVVILHLLAVTNILDVQNRSEPTTVLFQDGFQWPHFILTIDVLCELDLSSLTGKLVDICVKLYNSSLCTCTKVKPGFVIPMKEAQPILLKGLDVTDCPDLNCIISTAFSNHKPHLHSNLSNECSHVHRKLRELQHTSASTSVLMSDDEVEVEFAMSHAHVPTKRLITPAVSLDQSAIYQMFIQPKLWFPQHPLPSAPSMKPPLMRMLLSSPPMMRACRVFKSKRHSCQMKRRNTQHMHLWSANHHPNDVVILYWSANHHPQCLMTCCHQPNVLILYCHHPPPHSHWHWALDTLATMQLWLTMSLSGLLISML